MAEAGVAAAAALVARFAQVTGAERGNDQLIISELCGLPGLPAPGPAKAHAGDHACVHECRLSFAHGDGSQSFGFVDCCKRGALVLVAKPSRLSPTPGVLTQRWQAA